MIHRVHNQSPLSPQEQAEIDAARDELALLYAAREARIAGYERAAERLKRDQYRRGAQS